MYYPFHIVGLSRALTDACNSTATVSGLTFVIAHLREECNYVLKGVLIYVLIGDVFDS